MGPPRALMKEMTTMRTSAAFLTRSADRDSACRPAAAPPAAVPSCPELATALTALTRADARHATGRNLARYREANRALAPAAKRRARRVHGRLDHRRLAAAALRRLLHREAVRRPRHQRPDDAADAGPVPPGRHRSEAEGRSSFSPAPTTSPATPGSMTNEEIQGNLMSMARARQGPTASGSSCRASCR